MGGGVVGFVEDWFGWWVRWRLGFVEVVAVHGSAAMEGRRRRKRRKEKKKKRRNEKKKNDSTDEYREREMGKNFNSSPSIK